MLYKVIPLGYGTEDVMEIKASDPRAALLAYLGMGEKQFARISKFGCSHKAGMLLFETDDGDVMVMPTNFFDDGERTDEEDDEE